GDAEMLERTLRLRAPQPNLRHFDRSERILFDARLFHSALPVKSASQPSENTPRGNPEMKTRTVIVLAAVAGAALLAQAQQPKPEDQLKLRKAAYSLMNYAFGGIAGMAEGKRPYSKDEAIRLADLLAQVAT